MSKKKDEEDKISISEYLRQWRNMHRNPPFKYRGEEE